MKEIADVLAESREYIEKNGWWRGSLRGPNGKQVCSKGGILYSQGISEGVLNLTQKELVCRVDAALLEVINFQGDHYFGSIEAWNDDDDFGAKNKQHVLDVFAKAEKLARGLDPEAL